MIFILCAMPIEAKALIAHYRLSKDLSVHHFELFRSDQVTLAVSGMGKVAAAIATASTFCLLGTKNIKAAINFGFCGSVKHHPLGSLFYINKVSDNSTGKTFYPDVLLKHSLQESALSTFDKPVTSPDQIQSDAPLVDMEGAGFFEAAQAFVAPSRIACLKMVSDHVDGSFPKKEQLQTLIEQKSPELFLYIDCLSEFVQISDEKYQILNQSDLLLLTKVISTLRLTSAQSEILKQAALSSHARGNKNLECLTPLLSCVPATKKEGKKLFEQALASLNSEAR